MSWDYLFGNSDDKKTADNEEKLEECVIKEMQKKENQLIIEIGKKSETYFYAAQRLKFAKSLLTSDICPEISEKILDKLVEIAQYCPGFINQPISVVREKIKFLSDYLSQHVMKPEPKIDAFLKLLTKIDAQGAKMLIELEPLKKIKMSYKDALSKSFTSLNDKAISNDEISILIRTNLKKLMEDDALSGNDLAIMNEVINEQTGLLTSFLLLQREKANALDVLIEHFESNPNATLLQYGKERKSCADALYLLHGKTAQELASVVNPNQIVTKKLQLRLTDLLQDKIDLQRPHMNTILDDCTKYLAKHFADAPPHKICSCATRENTECKLRGQNPDRSATRPFCTCVYDPVTAAMPNAGYIECPTMAGKTKDGPSAPCPAQKGNKKCPGE